MEFDIEPMSFRKKKGSGVKWLFAAALVGAAGFGAVKLKLIPSQSAPIAPAAAVSPVPPPIETAQPAAPVVNTPVVAPAPTPDRQLADDVKQRLAVADKALAKKQQAKQQLQQTRAASTRS